ncbi:MAG: nitrous oxide reductase [Candidimonas sp.]|nr:MAG: nitrous oxide reductase [Candidimonas sp.]TAM23924.1 MAG: nitrous oxide reductase [Candidimonas sp.]
MGKAVILPYLLALSLGGCGNGQQLPPQTAADIRPDDTSAVCGMFITGLPGPRGEAYIEGRTLPLKFGSTRDFFGYILEPEHQQILQHLFVQDSALIDWTHPSNSAATFIDARKAWYVAWQPLPGDMGPTLASFAKRANAEAFVKARGGELLGFDEITPQLILSLASTCPQKGTLAFKLARHCMKGNISNAR